MKCHSGVAIMLEPYAALAMYLNSPLGQVRTVAIQLKRIYFAWSNIL